MTAAEPPESTLAAVLAEAPDRVIRKHLFTLYPEEITCDCGWVAKDPSDGRLLDLWCYHLAAILATPSAARLAELETALAAAEARLRAVDALAVTWETSGPYYPGAFYAEASAYASGRDDQKEVCADDLRDTLAAALTTPPQPAP